MSDYKSRCDLKCGYNQDSFAHKTVGTAVMGQLVKLIATPIALVSEAVRSQKSKSHSASDAGASVASPTPPTSKGAGSKKLASSSENQRDQENLAYVCVLHEEAH